MINIITAGFLISGILIIVLTLSSETLKDVFVFKTNITGAGERYALKRLPSSINKHMSKIPLLGKVKRDIEKDLMLLVDEDKAGYLSLAVVLACLAASLLIAAKIVGTSDYWYVKFLWIAVSVSLPIYAATLALEYYRTSLYKKVPDFIDQFRSAYSVCGRVRPALIECAKSMGIMGKVIMKAAEYPDLEKGLEYIKSRFRNPWINIFVHILLTGRDSGGDIVAQMHKLNMTAVMVMNMEKKKVKRLVWYEAFVLGSVIAGIPLVMWANNKMLVEMGLQSSNVYANMSTARLMAYSLLALAVMRVARKR